MDAQTRVVLQMLGFSDEPAEQLRAACTPEAVGRAFSAGPRTRSCPCPGTGTGGTGPGLT